MNRPLQALLLILPILAIGVFGFLAFINLGTASKNIELLQVFNLDEGAGTWQLLQNVQNRDFNPRGFFNYGYAYINMSHMLVKVIGFVGINTDSEQVLAITLRAVSLISWFLTGFFIFKAARNLSLQVHFALLASASLLMLPNVFEYAQFVHPDLLQVLFCSIAIYVLTNKRDTYFSVLLAAAFLGLAFGTKYSGIFLLPAVFLLLGYQFYKRRIDPIKFTIYTTLSVGLFLAFWIALNPYVLKEFPLFLEDFQYESQHVKRGHWRAEPANPLLWFEVLFSQFDYLIFVLTIGIASALYSLKTALFEKKELMVGIFLLCFMLGFGYLMLEVNMRRPRYLFHLLPLLVLVAFYGLNQVNLRLKNRAILPLLVLALLLFPMRESYAVYERYSQKMEHPYVKAGEWMKERYPEGIKVLSDYYSYLPKEHFVNAYHTFGVTKEEIDGHQPQVIVINKSLSGMRSWKVDGSSFKDLRIEATDRDGAEALKDFQLWLFSEGSGWKIVYEELNIVILEKELNTP